MENVPLAGKPARDVINTHQSRRQNDVMIGRCRRTALRRSEYGDVSLSQSQSDAI